MTLDEIDRATRPALIPMKIIPLIFTGTSLSGAYTMASRGELETITLGKRRLAVTAPIRAKFNLPPATSSAEAEAAGPLLGMKAA